MLNFSRPLTEIHGCLLVAGDKEEDIVRNVVTAVRDIRRRCRSASEMCSLARKIHLYLAVNTDLDWPPSMESLTSVSSCLGQVNKLSVKCYLDIIRDYIDTNSSESLISMYLVF